MKALICGGRNYSYDHLIKYVLQVIKPDIVIHGGAKGADTVAGEVAERMNIEVREYLADWAKYGKAAGPIRNQKMLDKESPDIVIAFHGGAGTANMVALAELANIPVFSIS